MVDARAVLSVTLVGLLCAAVLAGTHELTAARIKSNESARFRGELEKLLGAAVPDAVAASPVWERGVWRLCDGYAVARVKTPGYAGPIEVLVASASGDRAIVSGVAASDRATVSGVAVSSHTETPGIVDFLHPGSPWLADLRGAAAGLDSVDVVSGATISSSAVLRAVYAALEKMRREGDDVSPGCNS
jgi:Na+-translocating ferredoxin:NAD+ oxidoreductase RnfG subunit